MQIRKSHLAPAVTITAALVFAVTLFVTRGPFEALLMVVVVAVLVGMYMLRRYARTQLLYRRRADQRRPRVDGEPVSRAPAGGDVTGVGDGGHSNMAGAREMRLRDVTSVTAGAVSRQTDGTPLVMQSTENHRTG